MRCAIYTRKSTEEGLEQDFNSLDAQREACAAYVRRLCGNPRVLWCCKVSSGVSAVERGSVSSRGLYVASAFSSAGIPMIFITRFML